MYSKHIDEVLVSHHGSRLAKRLKPLELNILSSMAAEFASIAGADERMLKINRCFLDNPNKPKNWTIIVELLTLANSRAWAVERRP